METFHESQASAAAHWLEERFGAPPIAAVVAGSGLGAFTQAIREEAGAAYADIPGFAAATVAGHAGRLSVGRLADGTRMALLNGRRHAYEGIGAEAAAFAARAVALWGCRVFVATNAAGGVNPAYRPGDLMAIADHINLSFRRIAALDARGVPRGPAPGAVYDPGLRALLADCARRLGIRLRQGVYACNLGPSFETPAETRLLEFAGADAVGMSTAHEACAARQMGLRVLGLSYISNSLTARADGKTTHEEVLDNARLVMENAKRLLAEFLARLETERWQ